MGVAVLVDVMELRDHGSRGCWDVTRLWGNVIAQSWSRSGVKDHVGVALTDHFRYGIAHGCMVGVWGCLASGSVC